MPVQKGKQERRKYERFVLRKGMFALLQQNAGELASVIDGSMGGLGVRYAAEGEAIGKKVAITLFSSEEIALLKSLPATIVRIPKDMKTKSEPGGKRHCGLQFHNLSLHQKIILGDLIQQYAIEGA